MLQNGGNLAYIKAQLGCFSIKITADPYGALIPGANRTTVDPLDAGERHPGVTSLNEPGQSIDL